MQTFVPLPDFFHSAKVLDRLRLGKQRIETYQILNTLHGVSSGWINHPAVKMWEGYEQALVRYGFVMCIEWINRGYKDTTLPKIMKYLKKCSWKLPLWWNGKIHETHRSNLLRKNKDHYGQFGWTVSDNLPYFWPTNINVQSSKPFK